MVADGSCCRRVERKRAEIGTKLVELRAQIVALEQQTAFDVVIKAYDPTTPQRLRRMPSVVAANVREATPMPFLSF